MTKKQSDLILQLLSSLPDTQRDIFEELINYIVDLGYLPQKQSVSVLTLSFKRENRVIAKVAVKRGGQLGAFQLKFFACKNPPQKFIDALFDEIQSHNEQYCSPISLDRSEELKNKCDGCGTACTSSNIGYYWKFTDGREIFRCGSYPILIPDIEANDVPIIKKLITEQDTYFLSLSAALLPNETGWKRT